MVHRLERKHTLWCEEFERLFVGMPTRKTCLKYRLEIGSLESQLRALYDQGLFARVRFSRLDLAISIPILFDQISSLAI
jgi:hypothetical protein